MNMMEALKNIRSVLNVGGDRNIRENEAFHIANRALISHEAEDAIQLPYIDWEEKCWGRVFHAFHSPDVALSYLETKKGFCCSQHYHKNRVNFFLCITGSIVVERWVGITPVGVTIKKVLFPGDVMSVDCNICHQFEVIESGKVVEVYWPGDGPVRLDDIVRFGVGGPLE